MSLKGNLASVNLTEIFQMLSLSGREGTLFIYEGARKRAICFTREGVSIRSRERNETNLLGKILVRLGKIEEDGLQRAVELRRSSQKLLGDVLVDLRACTRDDVELAFRIQSEEDIQDLFLNRSDAQFEYIDGFFPDTDFPYVNLNVNSLLIEIARRMDEWEYIRRRIRGPGEIYRFTGNEVTVDADVLAECYSHRIDPFIDGTNSVGDLIDLSYVNKFEACKLLAAYLDASVIELVPHEAIRVNARMALRMGDPESAIRHYEYLMSSGDYPLEVVSEAAEAHEATRNFSEAAALLRRLAAELVRGGDHRAAIDALRRVANYPRPEPDALRFLMDLVFENPRVAAEFEEHIIEGGRTLVAYYLRQDDRQEAHELLVRLLQAFPDEVSFAIALVDLLYEQGDAGRASRECERLAASFLKRRKPTHAVSLYKKLLVIDPERQDVRDRIRKLASGKPRRQRAAAGPRVAILIALLLLLGGVAVVMVQGDGSWTTTTREGAGFDDGTLAALVTRSAQEQGQAEQHCSLAIERYGRLQESLTDDLLATGEGFLARLREADKSYQLFEQHADRVQQIAETILRQALDERTAARARGLLTAMRDRDTEVRSTRSRFLVAAQGVAERLHAQGTTFYEEGRLASALDCFRLAQALASKRDWKAEVNLDLVIQNIEADSVRVRQSFDTAHRHEQQGDWIAARRIYLDLLEEFRSADLIAEMRLPVEILTRPLGAEVLVDGESAAPQTPAIVRLSPFRPSQVVLRKEGYLEQSFALGPFDEDLEASRYTEVRDLRRAATWVFRLGQAVESAPVALGGKIACAGREGEWFLLDASSGETLAREELDTFDGVSAGLAAGAGHVIVPTLDGRLILREVPLGSAAGSLPGFDSGLYATPLVADGRLYAADHAGLMRAYDLRTRKVVWERKTPHGVRAPLVAQGEDLVVLSAAGNVTVLRRSDGAVAGEFVLEGVYHVAPAVDGASDLVFQSEGGVLTHAERRKGTVRWSFDAGQPLPSPPIVRGNAVFLSPQQGDLLALDSRTGREMYRYRRSGDAVRTAVAPTGRIFFVNGERLSAFAARADGYALAWDFVAEARILGGPVVAEGSVYIGDEAGNLYRVEAEG